MRPTWLLAGLVALAVLIGPAAAQYPEKPIRVIVPTATGGSIDMNARLFERVLESTGLLGQPLTIVNVAGAAGAVGLRQVKDAAPDGHTIGIWHNGLVLANIMGVVDFDHDAFEIVAQTGSSALGFGVRDDRPWRTLPELVAAAKAAPDTIRNAMNVGLPVHVVALMLGRETGARFRYVQVGGGSQRLASLLGGHTDFSGFSPQELIAFKAQGIRPLVVLAERRVPQLPEVPTAREAGIDLTWTEERFWIAPKGTPPDRIGLLADRLEAAMARPEVQTWMAEQAIEPSFARGTAARAKLTAVAAKLTPIAADLKAPPAQ
jgi:tripartite-type tricarboxylate transporter receptor subunit TctC